MQANFDVFDYAGFLRERWRLIACATVAALLVSLSVSLALPKRYTATASIVIEPPGGSDARTATAVSPVYLESLKTYERFAESDSLFADAVDKFHLSRSTAIESLKQRVLKVTKLRDTKILEIQVTLPDAQMAHGMAEYLAQQTVVMSRSESLSADADVIEEMTKQAADARSALERAQQAAAADAQLESIESLQADLDGTHELQFDVRRSLSDAQADAAESSNGNRTRIAALEAQSANLSRAGAAQGAALSARISQREKIQRDLQSAQTSLESANNRLRDMRAAAGSRGERLRVIDPGIVPQRPASPNVPLNVLAALFLAAVLSIGYLSIVFAYQRRTVEFEPALARTRRAG